MESGRKVLVTPLHFPEVSRMKAPIRVIALLCVLGLASCGEPDTSRTDQVKGNVGGAGYMFVGQCLLSTWQVGYESQDRSMFRAIPCYKSEADCKKEYEGRSGVWIGTRYDGSYQAEIAFNLDEDIRTQLAVCDRGMRPEEKQFLVVRPVAVSTLRMDDRDKRVEGRHEVTWGCYGPCDLLKRPKP